jgi:hypothetical protein
MSFLRKLISDVCVLPATSSINCVPHVLLKEQGAGKNSSRNASCGASADCVRDESAADCVSLSFDLCNFALVFWPRDEFHIRRI